MKKREKIDIIRSLRMYVVISFFLLWIGVIVGFFNPVPVDYIYAEVAIVSLGFIMFYKFSVALGFCSLHRTLIMYTYLIVCCIWWRRYFNIGYLLDGVRIVLTVVGFILFVWILINYLYARKR